MLLTDNDRRAFTKELMDSLYDLDERFDLENDYPGPKRDLLFQSDYRHAHKESIRCSRCEPGSNVCRSDCDDMGYQSDKLVKRDRLAHMSGTIGSPIVHFGDMGAGDSVIKSSSERDKVAEEYSLITFEMEGAGVWSSFPTVIIKAASDYADSHKNKGWQHYAAAVAASGLKAFLKKQASTQDAMSDVESRRYSILSLDDGLSIVSDASTIRIEVEDSQVQDRPNQESRPSFIKRILNSRWRTEIASAAKTILSSQPFAAAIFSQRERNLRRQPMSLDDRLGTLQMDGLEPTALPQFASWPLSDTATGSTSIPLNAIETFNPASSTSPEYKVLFIAASVSEFNIDSNRREQGYPYLRCVAGEIFDVLKVRGELWLAYNEDDDKKELGWLWSKHFAKLES